MSEKQNFTECGKVFGGVWWTDKTGAASYVPLECNKETQHLGDCAFLDPRSGMYVYKARNGRVEVDENGCVRDL